MFGSSWTKWGLAIFCTFAICTSLYEVDRKINVLEEKLERASRIERKRHQILLLAIEESLRGGYSHIQEEIWGRSFQSLSASPKLDVAYEQLRERIPPVSETTLHYPQFALSPGKPLEFHPYQAAINVFGLARSGEPASIQSAEKMLEMAKAFLKTGTCYQNGGAVIWFAHPFEFTLGERFVYETGWVSALAQGFWLAALVELYLVTRKDDHLHLAQQVLASLACIRSAASRQNEWVSFVDEGSYLWFEEYPKGVSDSAKVLNGHIWVLRSLYRWLLAFPDDKIAMTLLKGGIATVERYGHYYRNPGGANLYDMQILTDDYWFDRTLDDQRWLYNISGLERFKMLEEWFRSDAEFQ